jgi:hypothetical protein
MNFNHCNLLAGFTFGTLGWGWFFYGRKLDLCKPRVIRLALMGYPYVVTFTGSLQTALRIRVTRWLL